MAQYSRIRSMKLSLMQLCGNWLPFIALTCKDAAGRAKLWLNERLHLHGIFLPLCSKCLGIFSAIKQLLDSNCSGEYRLSLAQI